MIECSHPNARGNAITDGTVDSGGVGAAVARLH
jgi:hypothetical protein